MNTDNHIPCSQEGCANEGTRTAEFTDSKGCKTVVQLCPTHVLLLSLQQAIVGLHERIKKLEGNQIITPSFLS